MTKIKEDEFGLYVIAGGWIARPFFGTIFQKDDVVKSHHFGGSTKAGVTVIDKPDTHNFKRKGIYETWATTGIMSHEKISKEKTKEKIEWYKKHSETYAIVKNPNANFVK